MSLQECKSMEFMLSLPPLDTQRTLTTHPHSEPCADIYKTSHTDNGAHAVDVVDDHTPRDVFGTVSLFDCATIASEAALSKCNSETHNADAPADAGAQAYMQPPDFFLHGLRDSDVCAGAEGGSGEMWKGCKKMKMKTQVKGSVDWKKTRRQRRERARNHARAMERVRKEENERVRAEALGCLEGDVRREVERCMEEEERRKREGEERMRRRERNRQAVMKTRGRERGDVERKVGEWRCLKRENVLMRGFVERWKRDGGMRKVRREVFGGRRR